MYTPFEDTFPFADLVPVEGRLHQIGELAEKFGITLRTIRFYEERGLIRPRRIASRARFYDVADVTRLSLIVALRRYGFAIEAVTELLAARDRLEPAAFRAHLAAALTERRTAIEAEIAESRRLCDGLQGWLAGLDTGV